MQSLVLAGDDVSANTKGERALLHARQPLTAGELPEGLRRRAFISFNTSVYDLRAAAVSVLAASGPELGFGSFQDGSRIIEEFVARDEVFTSFKAEMHWRQCVRDSVELCDAFHRLVREVICPFLKSGLDGDAPRTFYYQFPPTLRLQPGPSEHKRRLHRDAEYGHQPGEVNFWMPLSNFSKTGTTLWVESEPLKGDLGPLEIEYGTIAMFHGTVCRHFVPANPSNFTRVSLDFRVGVDEFYDPAWRLAGMKTARGKKGGPPGSHGREVCVV
uniref:Fe2OG dioxygenase domain-containing protein n=1 Tax=Noctiluca scintillans TaxID=2966 RepID=A0A7S1AML5_NOCSC|mmetsp:Transcript_5240/g.14842  ORF Transcript_5240/g.14842 Transcript_5240/m.14842 type:complete len:272 (+) Transcript_5240:18-833(+)